MGGVEYCELCFSMHSAPSFPVFLFWTTGTRLAPPAVKETCCISHKRRTYTLQWIWQHVEAVFSATFLLKGSDERQRSNRIKAVGLSLGGVWGPLETRAKIFTHCHLQHNHYSRISPLLSMKIAFVLFSHLMH